MSWDTRGLVRDLRSGRAQYRIFTVPNPAAGAGFSFTVDSLGWLQILAIRFALTTDVNVANRMPRIEYRDGDGNDLLRQTCVSPVAASLGATISFISGYPAFSAPTPTAHIAPLVDWPLMVGWSVFCNLTNGQVGDQISAIRVTAIDWATLTGDQAALATQMEDL